MRRETAFSNASAFDDPNKALAMSNLLTSLDDPFFWTSPRKVQIVALLARVQRSIITHRDIALVMRVSEAVVSRYWHYMMERPNAPFRRPGRPSPFDEVFGHVKNFIQKETRNNRSVTMGSLMEFLADKHNVFATRRQLWEYMTTHGFSYIWGIPTEEERAVPDVDKLREFYTRGLPEAVGGVHPSLVFNVDEMGAERFADRKHVKVFVPQEEAPADGRVSIGIKRTSRRCTLVACVALDGSRLKPAIIANNKTINSRLFETGLTPKDITVYWSKSAFVDGAIFLRWLREVFVPHVEATRERLRQLLGQFDDRAVLVLDGCKCHTQKSTSDSLHRKTSR